MQRNLLAQVISFKAEESKKHVPGKDAKAGEMRFGDANTNYTKLSLTKRGVELLRARVILLARRNNVGT